LLRLLLCLAAEQPLDQVLGLEGVDGRIKECFVEAALGRLQHLLAEHFDQGAVELVGLLLLADRVLLLLFLQSSFKFLNLSGQLLDFFALGLDSAFHGLKLGLALLAEPLGAHSVLEEPRL